jgi:hypothetical protein
MMKLILVTILSLVLTGCASQSIYQWGGYEQMLYQGYKDPTKMEVMQVELASHIKSVEQSGKRVAPGLYAELGTLSLQSGDQDMALALYARERDTWPESRGLMEAMIKNIERRKKPDTETQADKE